MTEPVREDELHAYVDGMLPSLRREEVEAWLATHPADAARVQGWASQNRALHAAFDGVLDEPVPADLLKRARQRRSRFPLQALAATLALVAAGLIGYGAGLRTAVPQARVSPLAQDAAIAHAVFTPEQRHPVEVDAAHATHLVAWLSNRVGTQLRAPDFSNQGFALLGGRLLADETGPVAQFMYHDTLERRVTLYVRRAVDGKQETAFRHFSANGVEVFYWVDRDFGYALSGQIGRGDMQELADIAYAQLVNGR